MERGKEEGYDEKEEEVLLLIIHTFKSLILSATE